MQEDIHTRGCRMTSARGTYFSYATQLAFAAEKITTYDLRANTGYSVTGRL